MRQLIAAAYTRPPSKPQRSAAGSHDPFSQPWLAVFWFGTIAFTIDQQQYLQGYLPILLLYLYVTNLNTAGGGLPILTGPGFVDQSNADQVAALVTAGTR